MRSARSPRWAVAFRIAPACAADKMLLDGCAAYPEGPLFVGDTLYVAEMGADRVSTYDRRQEAHVLQDAMAAAPTAIAPYRDRGLSSCAISRGELALSTRRARNSSVSAKACCAIPMTPTPIRWAAFISPTPACSARTSIPKAGSIG